MNHSTAVFLINDNVRAVMATYEAEDNAKRSMFKTFDETIAVGDFVIVPTDTRHKMTVCKIVEVDVDWDFDPPATVHWIISRVDRSGFTKLVEQEAVAVKAIRTAEMHKKRNDLREAMLGASMETIKALPLAKVGAETQ